MSVDEPTRRAAHSVADAAMHTLSHYEPRVRPGSGVIIFRSFCYEVVPKFSITSVDFWEQNQKTRDTIEFRCRPRESGSHGAR